MGLDKEDKYTESTIIILFWQLAKLVVITHSLTPAVYVKGLRKDRMDVGKMENMLDFSETTAHIMMEEYVRIIDTNRPENF